MTKIEISWKLGDGSGPQDSEISGSDSPTSHEAEHHPNDNKSRILQSPAILITIATTITYLLGYNFYMSYFSTLSLPYNSLDLPLIYYIDKLILILPIVLIATLVLIKIIDNPGKIKISQYTKFVYVLPLIFIYLYFILIFNIGYLSLWSGLIIIVSCIGVSILYYFRDKEVPISSDFKIILILIFLLFIVFFPHILGIRFAQDFSEEKATNTFYINITYKNENDTDLPKDGLLVIYNNDKYYIANKFNASSNDNMTRVYIISSDQIKFASIERNNPGNLERLYNFFI